MIREIKLNDAKNIALIHFLSLPEDFLPSLGFKFLKSFYTGVIGKPGIFGFVNLEGSEIAGFVVGSENMDVFFKNALKSNFFKLIYLLLIEVAKKPIILINIIETLFYTKKESGPSAELIVIAVDKKYRGKGIGRKLINTLDKEMKKRKINFYKLTVTKRNKGAKAFYENLGFYKYSKFFLYQKEWNVLVKKL